MTIRPLSRCELLSTDWPTSAQGYPFWSHQARRYAVRARWHGLGYPGLCSSGCRLAETRVELATSKFCVKRSTRGKPKYYSHQHTDILDRVELYSFGYLCLGSGCQQADVHKRGNDRRLSPLHIQLGRRRPRTRLARPKWWLGARAAHSRHPGAACRS